MIDAMLSLPSTHTLWVAPAKEVGKCKTFYPIIYEYDEKENVRILQKVPDNIELDTSKRQSFLSYASEIQLQPKSWALVKQEDNTFHPMYWKRLYGTTCVFKNLTTTEEIEIDSGGCNSFVSC